MPVAGRGKDGAMWTYYPDLLETPVPRYTSFPTAAEFGPGVGSADLAQALETSSGAISLYAHIPFCEKICWYCGCNTGAANRTQRLSDYLTALRSEIAMVAKRIGGRARVQRIAFGGRQSPLVKPGIQQVDKGGRGAVKPGLGAVQIAHGPKDQNGAKDQAKKQAKARPDFQQLSRAPRQGGRVNA